MNSFLTMTDKVTITFNWLNGERAKAIAAICKEKGASKVRRLAQGGKRAMGYCKVVAEFNSHPGWATNNATAGAAKKAVIEAGLTNELTFQA